MRARAERFRSRLDARLSEVQSVVEYVRVYRIRVGEEAYSLSIHETTRYEERGDCSAGRMSGAGDIIEVVVPPSNPTPGAS